VGGLGAGARRRYLPLAEAETAAVMPAPGRPDAAGRETVLVVEDERMVRSMAVRGLREEGYTVLEAGSGAEALELIDRHAADVGLVLTDVTMAEMGGRELGHRLASRRPDLPVLYMSGHPLDEIVRRGLLQERQPFLQKPFAPDALLDAVRMMLHTGVRW
jgi:two-component system cell cycle sensor histidine kinase/response regulator CckA